MLALALLAAWTVDRFEPPFAVLLGDAGQVVDVPVERLPAGAAPGDRLARPTGPIIERGSERRDALARRLAARVGVATPAAVGQGPSMRKVRDSYARRAQREGFAARSVYKLEEIDGRVRLLRPGDRVLDLGCAPGSWMQYVVSRVGARGRVVGVDLKEVKLPPDERVTVLTEDVFTVDAERLLQPVGRFHVVLSDMAPATSGNRFSDHVRSMELCHRAFELATRVLRPGGSFVCKAFDGQELPELVAAVRAGFEQFRRIKPKGTRAESVELYLVGQRFRGTKGPRDNDSVAPRARRRRAGEARGGRIPGRIQPTSNEVSAEGSAPECRSYCCAGPKGGNRTSSSRPSGSAASENREGSMELERLPVEIRQHLDEIGPGVPKLIELRDGLREGRLGANAVRGALERPQPGDVEKIPEDPTRRHALCERGMEALRAGEVGLVLLNGGMATRFGGVVKGVVPVDGDRTLLELKVRDAQRIARAAGAVTPPILLMNSRATTAATERYLEAVDWFGETRERIRRFEQQWAVRLQTDGRVFLDEHGEPSFYAPGHGDLVPCLRRSGELEAFRAAGGRTLLMSNVDNVVATLDPLLLGWHLERGAAVTAEMVEHWPGDVGGVPLRVGGKLQIVEAFRLPADFDHQAVGVFSCNTFWLDAAALDRDVELTWFATRKQVEGQTVVQFERLVNELTVTLPTAFLEVPRSGAGTRFVPLKERADLERERDALLAAWTGRAHGLPTE